MTNNSATDRPGNEPVMNRRHAMGGLVGAGVLAMTGGGLGAARAAMLSEEELGFDRESGRYTLAKLPYAYDALEPVIDEQTMRIHHGKHHQGYINGLNRALDKLAEIRDGTGDAGLIKHWSRELSFHGSGHVNHAMFWTGMAPTDRGGGGSPEGDLAAQIRADFGSFDKFKAHFVAASKSVEGSGWGWLVWEPVGGRFLVIQGEKQQDMMMTGVVPLLGVDVWEHAYYLRYQNRRAEYVSKFLDIVNWIRVAERFELARA